MREIRPQINDDPVDGDIASEVQREGRVRIPVDPPGSVGPLAVAGGCGDAVDGVLRSEYSLTACLYVGGRMREAGAVLVAVVYVESQIAVGAYLEVTRFFQGEQMTAAGEGLR